MRLTKQLRETFVDAVLADIPRIDHNEAIKARMYEDIRESAPGPVVQLFNDPELRHFVVGGRDTFRPEASGALDWRENLDWQATINGYEPSPKAAADFTIIAKSHEMQALNIKRVKQTLTGIINSCGTTKTALEKLPEFAKYLPADVETSTNLPAVANLSAELIALGWPKK